MENTNDIQLRESIYKNFINLQDIIRFAEAKNAAMLALSGTVITLVFDKIYFKNFFQIVFVFGYVLVFIALIIALWSFIPFTHPNKIKAKFRNKQSNNSKNLFLFSDIASFDAYEKFEIEIKEKYYGSIEMSAIEKDVLLQIYTNAHITYRKLNFFKASLFSFLFGIFLIVIFGPLK